MSNRPLYARFYKCDLHMHTPLDPCWRDESTRLRHDDPEERKREVARLYLKACHEVGLEIIAITDHNFAPSPEQSFLSWLSAENALLAQEVGRSPLVIFPGFEIQCKVGRGGHMLCLFNPETDLQVIHDKLAGCGLPGGKRFVNGQPQPADIDLPSLLNLIQGNPIEQERPASDIGIVIAAHPDRDKGMLALQTAEHWWRIREFQNEHLRAVEIPKIPGNLTGWLRCVLNNEDEGYKRKQKIGWVMSSDCYSIAPLRVPNTTNELEATDGSPSDRQEHNYIGFRHTWIKMSCPSIESLRQAFLDRDSRIRFGAVRPDEQYTYPKIRRVMVKDAKFLRRIEEIHWSPNLNCLIGSRGTGKSTLLDYMRAALDRLRSEDIPPTLAKEVRSRVKDTLDSNTRIEVDLETRGDSYRVVYTGEGDGKWEIFPSGAAEPDSRLDVRSLFRCRFLSQREIDHSVGRRDRVALRRFLDEFLPRELGDLERQEQDLRGKINQIETALATKRENQERRKAIETEQRDLESRLRSQKRLSKLLPLWQGIETERDFFERLFKECAETISLWRERLEDLEFKSTLLTEDLRNSPNARLIADAAQKADAAEQRLRETMQVAVNAFEEATCGENSPLRALRQEQWKPLYEEAKQQFEMAQKEAQAEGVNIQSITEIPQQLLMLKFELFALDQEQVAINQLERERQSTLPTLRQVWRLETEVRQRKADELMERLRPRPGAKPYVEIRIEHQADRDEIVEMLTAKIPDQRRLNKDDIKALIDRLASESPVESPLTLMERFVAEARKGEKSDILREVLDRRREAFLDAFTEPLLRQLETERIPDYVMYYVYRQDGTSAGPIDKVSAGQQGTAILNLLLAEGDEPLVVDTPEEGLDNEGVYAELVPLFRLRKEKRQIIIVTHNANLPVNADAEGIVALEAAGFVPDRVLNDIVCNCGQSLNPEQQRHLGALIRWSDWEAKVEHYLKDSQHWSQEAVEQALREIGNARQAEGRVKVMVEPGGTQRVAVGALDTPAVKCAVQDIMEGSEEAFRQRREKYGF